MPGHPPALVHFDYSHDNPFSMGWCIEYFAHRSSFEAHFGLLVIISVIIKAHHPARVHQEETCSLFFLFSQGKRRFW